SLPIVVTTQKLEAIVAGNSPTFPDFHAAMVFVDLTHVGMFDFLKIVLLRQTEKQLYIFLETWLVTLHSQQIVRFLVHDLLGDLRLAAYRINGDDAAGNIQQLQE